MCSSSPSPPPAPDYTGAAQATAAGNLDAARAAATANRVNQITPQGNLTYQVTGQDSHGNDVWTATQNYSPDQQQIYQGQTDLSKGLLNTAQTGLGYVNNSLGTGGALDESKIAQAPIQGQTVQDAVMSRLQPQIQHNRDALTQQLANQGITPGSDAWNYAMKQQGQNENDLYTQAALQGINTGLTARQQGIQEQYAQQDRPLNIVNALRTGSQVSTPQFVNAPQQQTTTGPNYLGAAQAQGQYDMNTYNAQQQANSGFMGGLMNLGGMIGSAGIKAGWFGSDRAIKENIEMIGTRPDGIGIYEFYYKPEYREEWGNGKQVGVMADEVEKVIPEAVSVHEAGYKMVNYSLLG